MASRDSDCSQFAEGWRPDTLLGGLSAPLRAEMVCLGDERDFAAGDVLVRQGSDRRETLLLLRGYVRVTASSGGLTELLTIRAQGDVVGDPVTTVISSTPVVARVLPPDVLEGFLAPRPEAAALLQALKVAQLAGANRRRVEFATLTVRERLAWMLIELMAVLGEDGPGGSVRMPSWFGKADLAGLTGALPNDIRRGLRSLHAEGLIDAGEGPLTVLAPAKLDAIRLR
ncbi:Crp/Fnr family transcriptional regulator [Actinoplanes sp. NPDC051494]|uniref:Crp/Fnr family transcriptional regulator n=1 Tax=Actinoplanes sp. NPDC051494 TaxID=3363907 RepID=UPI0037947BDD